MPPSSSESSGGSASAPTAAARLERKNSVKSSPSPSEKRCVRASDMVHRVAQLEELLKKEKAEKLQALQELASRGATIEALANEVANAKESEKKMLESLMHQTKQLEQAKIALEEAKLEIKNLQDSTGGGLNSGSAVAAACRSGRDLGRSFREALMSIGAEDEARKLRGELRAAVQSEEKSRKAADDLAATLAQVTAEAKQLKRWLADAMAELEDAKAEAEHLRAVTADLEKFKLEVEDKERVLVECLRSAESEKMKERQDTVKLAEALRVVRDESSRLRDVVKQTVSEVNDVKESLEIARKENSRLARVVAEKETALLSLRQDYESLRVSEATAQSSLRELNNMLAATATTTTTTSCSSKAASLSESPLEQELKVASFGDDQLGEREMALPPRQNGGRRHSIGEPAKFRAVGSGGSPQDPKKRALSSVSNMTDMKAAAAAIAGEFDLDEPEDDEDEGDYHNIDAAQLDGPETLAKEKKKPLLRKFGNFFKRKNSSK